MLRISRENLERPSHASAHTAGWHLRCILRRLGTLDGLIHGEYECSSLTSCRQSVDLDNGRLPDACLEIVGDIFLHDINTIPVVTYQNKREEINQTGKFSRGKCWRWKSVQIQSLTIYLIFLGSLSRFSPWACFCLNLFKIFVASKPALSHNCLGITSSAFAKAPINSCSLPAIVRE